MGHREGEALTKIDSLGFQLASLLDNHDHIEGLDVSHIMNLLIGVRRMTTGDVSHV